MDALYWIIFIVIVGPAFGALMGVMVKPSPRFLCISFSFAAGIMLAVSLLQLIPDALDTISIGWVVVTFLGGFILMFVVDRLLPHFHAITDEDEHEGMQRTALALMVGISLHNLPEGFAVGASFTSDDSLGLLVALAISLHDMPETLIPVASFMAIGKSKQHSFSMGALATIPTLIGLALGYALLDLVSSNIVAGAIVVTAAIMIYISGDELIPAAQKLGYPHLSNFALALGIVFVMGLAIVV